VKEVLRDQNDADVTVMAAFREQDQQIVEDHEARSATSVFKKICRDALVKMYVTLLRQFCRRRNRGLLAIAPDNPAVEITFRTQGVEVLQEPHAERRLAGSTRSTYYARERVLKFKVITHGWAGYNGTPLPKEPLLFIPKRDGRVVV